jgi:crotonobetainyl-CoA hydratase
MGATEAASWGLVNQVVAADQLLPGAKALARQMVQNAPLALAAVKEVLRATEGQTLQQAYQNLRTGELPHYRRMLVSEDAKEGPQAFSEKRTPRWAGR